MPPTQEEAQNKIQCNVVRSMFGVFYFVRVFIWLLQSINNNRLLQMPCQYCSNSPILFTLHKENPGPTLNKKTRLCGILIHHVIAIYYIHSNIQYSHRFKSLYTKTLVKWMIT